MSLLIIGIIVIIAGFVVSKSDGPYVQSGNIIKIVGILIVIAGVVLSSVKQIEPGQVGVQKLFGKVNNTTLESGLNVVNPLVQIETFDIRTQNYTMSGVHDEGTKSGDDAIRVLSADGLEVIVDLTVLYRVISSEAPRILKEIGTDYRNTIVRPICRTKIRDNAVYYDAVALYSTKRDEFQGRIFSSIEKDFKSRGLLLEQLLVRNLTLPESVKATIESKINAEQDAQKMTFVLQKEKQEAERKRVEAQGIADYQKILSTGLSDKQLQYEMIKAIATSPNAKLIIMGNGKGTPIILDGK
ncbi:MAG: prohibitin family protein [Bacteroidetes bacterium]|nr:prohibitin family protein [Bacteroidales bacterium]NJO68251.1 prohibitin family protein [Bacteroidota bacterium]